MKTLTLPVLIVAVAMGVAMAIPDFGESSGMEPCEVCCDFEPTNTAGVYSVVRGEKGAPGEPGMPGDMGVRGPKGDVGHPGEYGIDGQNGVNGEMGDKGEKGERGDIGKVGYTGETGARGPRGIKGVKGSRGDDGVKGEKGEINNMEKWPVFSVVRTKPQDGASKYTTLNYDTTYVNIGEDLDLDTGVFTCEVPGVYFFTISTLKAENKHVAAFVMVNDEPSARLYADGEDWQSIVTQSLAVSLKKGHTVWIRIDKYEEYEEVRLDANYKRHTVFTGQLIRPAF